MSAAVKPSIAIIGAGIGGMTTARALLRRGFTRVRIFEQADKFYPTAGAGFGFGPNGQMCMLSLGLEHQHILHPFDTLMRLDLEGNIKAQADTLKQVRQKFGFGIAGCLRADLIDLLAKSMPSDTILYSHKLTHIQQDAHKVQLEFDQSGNLVQEEFDLVIGADGINSQVAQQLKIDPSPPAYSGANIFYGKIDLPDSVNFQHPALQNLDHKVTNGPGTGEFIMFKVGGDEKKTLIWANTYVSSAPPPKAQEWDHNNRTMENLAEILQKFPSKHPIHELFEYTTPENVLHFGLSYRNHKKVWSKGRVCLIGDSCHATLPYMGQGANMAIEDAVVMAECLDMEHPNYNAAFQAFFDRRSKRTRRIVNFGNLMDKLYHSKNSIMKMLLDWILGSALKGGLVLRQLEKDIIEECPVDHAQYRKNFDSSH